jgi:hypothetical protein
MGYNNSWFLLKSPDISFLININYLHLSIMYSMQCRPHTNFISGIKQLHLYIYSLQHVRVIKRFFQEHTFGGAIITVYMTCTVA